MISAHAHFTYITKTDNILHVHSLIAYKKTTNKEFKRCIILSLSLSSKVVNIQIGIWVSFNLLTYWHTTHMSHVYRTTSMRCCLPFLTRIYHVIITWLVLTNAREVILINLPLLSKENSTLYQTQNKNLTQASYRQSSNVTYSY